MSVEWRENLPSPRHPTLAPHLFSDFVIRISDFDQMAPLSHNSVFNGAILSFVPHRKKFLAFAA